MLNCKSLNFGHVLVSQIGFFYSMFFKVKVRDLSFPMHFQTNLYLSWLFFYTRKHFDICETTSKNPMSFLHYFRPGREIPQGKKIKCPIFKWAQIFCFCSYGNVNHMKTILLEQEKEIMIVKTCYNNVMNIVAQYKVEPNFAKNSS